MHQVIGVDPVVVLLEPAQGAGYRHSCARHTDDRGLHAIQPPLRQPPDPNPQQERGKGFGHQRRHRIKCRNDRPLAQTHQPKQDTRAKIRPDRAQHLQIGGRN